MIGSLISGFWHQEACPYPAGYDEPSSGKAQTIWVKSEDRKVSVGFNCCLFVFIPTTYAYKELYLLRAS